MANCLFEKPHSRPIVSYYFPKGVGEHHYGVYTPLATFTVIADCVSQERHPMKPHRLSLTNALVMGYGLDKQIHHIYNPRPATRDELLMYHDSDYVDFLSRYDSIVIFDKYCQAQSFPPE